MSRRIAVAAAFASLVLVGASTPIDDRTILEARHGGHAEPAAMVASTSKVAMGGHVHHSGPAKDTLNETAVLLSHQPDPLSYYAYDYHYHLVDPATGALARDVGEAAEAPRWPGLMRAHVVTMILAYFIFLPLALMLKIPDHPLHIPFKILFAATLALSLILAKAYSASTPDLYVGNKHGAMSWWLAIMSFGLTAIDLGAVVRNVFVWARSSADRRSWSMLPLIFLGSKSTNDGYEEVTLEAHELVEEDQEAPPAPEPERPSHRSRRGYRPELSIDVPARVSPWLQRCNDSYPPRAMSHSSDSARSDDTLHHHGNTAYAPTADEPSKRPAWLSRSSSASSTGTPIPSSVVVAETGRFFKMFLERASLLWAFACMLSGTAVYSGICRAEYRNGCMAHTIKGGIFLWYGILTWGRYLGAFAEHGWSWNRKPSSNGRSYRDKMPSAEFVESFVIFLYGATNTWLERLGARPGEPYNVKTVQHISIAVMFWFAGLMGMLLELPSVRRFLSSTVATQTGRPLASIAPPPSYAFSFNPFPALVIGVTGVAMAAHHQEYKFQVAIHSLWGILLAGFAVLRCATYTFLWLRPPVSVLPSRPPTEALASVSLACGGMVFILSTEQIGFAAMRHGFDDMMAFLNVTVATICFVFAWVVVLLTLKGWAVARMQAATSRSSSRMPSGRSTPRGSHDREDRHVAFVDSPTNPGAVADV